MVADSHHNGEEHRIQIHIKMNSQIRIHIEVKRGIRIPIRMK
jgi:hypothetical protein